MKQNQKPCTKLKKVIDRGKRSMTLSEVKPVKNVNKNLQSFLEISPVQNEVLSYKLGDHAYEYYCFCMFLNKDFANVTGK